MNIEGCSFNGAAFVFFTEKSVSLQFSVTEEFCVNPK